MVFAIRALVFKSFARGKVHFSLLIFELKTKSKNYPYDVPKLGRHLDKARLPLILMALRKRKLDRYFYASDDTCWFFASPKLY